MFNWGMTGYFSKIKVMAKKKEDNIEEVKIKLDTLIRVKVDLEQSLKNHEKNIRKYNSQPKDSKCPIDMEEELRLHSLKLDQLLHFKNAIREGNSAKIKGSVYTNDHYIYELSNLNRKKALFISLNTFEGKRTSFKDSTQKIEYSANIKHVDAQKKVEKLNSDIRQIEQLLSDFNHTVEVEVLVYEELGIL